MGSSASYLLKPQEINEFRKLQSQDDNFEIPETAENRVKTNQKWLIVIGVAIVLLFPFLIYTLVHADTRRITHGSDSCGNVCGYQNEKVDDIYCSGKDYTSLPYAKHDAFDTECVRECPSDYNEIGYNCFRKTEHGHGGSSSGDGDVEVTVVHTLNEAFAYTRSSWWKFIFCIVITIALCVGVLYLYRFATAVIVWSILIFSTLVVVVLTIALWFVYFNTVKEEERTGALYPAIVMSIFSICIVILLAVLFKKIKLVIQLYKEATKAVFAMPGLILIPVISTWVHMIVLVLFITTSIFMFTAGVLTKVTENVYEYQPNGVMSFTLIYNLIIYFWISQFIVGCQYMTIAGSVSKWFFTRNKEYLGAPITTGAAITFKFHLGSVALGSFIITLVAIIKAIIQSLIKNEKTRMLVDCCMGNIEQFIKFLSKNAYIEVAIHGQAFLKSGRRAAKLLMSNATSLIAVNSVGDFVLGMTQLILIIICTGISYGIFSGNSQSWLPTVFMFFINLIIVLIMFAVFETTIDSLFICFCEDKVLNDGMAKPYYMSRALMEFVESSKLVYDKKE